MCTAQECQAQIFAESLTGTQHMHTNETASPMKNEDSSIRFDLRNRWFETDVGTYYRRNLMSTPTDPGQRPAFDSSIQQTLSLTNPKYTQKPSVISSRQAWWQLWMNGWFFVVVVVVCIDKTVHSSFGSSSICIRNVIFILKSWMTIYMFVFDTRRWLMLVSDAQGLTKDDL